VELRQDQRYVYLSRREIYIETVTLSVSPLSEAIKGLWVVCHLYARNKLKEKCSFVPQGLSETI